MRGSQTDYSRICLLDKQSVKGRRGPRDQPNGIAALRQTNCGCYRAIATRYINIHNYHSIEQTLGDNRLVHGPEIRRTTLLFLVLTAIYSAMSKTAK